LRDAQQKARPVLKTPGGRRRTLVRTDPFTTLSRRDTLDFAHFTERAVPAQRLETAHAATSSVHARCSVRSFSFSFLDNHLRTRVAAVYRQDQIELSRFVQLLAGVRFDVFDLKYRNNRTGDQLGRVDDLVSPRVGLVVKPIVPLSLYGSYSVSYLPSSGTAATCSRRSTTPSRCRDAPTWTQRCLCR
jgi:outer membrane receptor protein involved in Fe transport